MEDQSVDALVYETESNCVSVRTGGKQQEVSYRSVIKSVNPLSVNVIQLYSEASS